MRLSKAEFLGFLRIFCREMGEFDMNDIFLSFCKRLEVPHNKDDKEKEDTLKGS